MGLLPLRPCASARAFVALILIPSLVLAENVYAPEPVLSPCRTANWRTSNCARIEGDRLVVDVPKEQALAGGWVDCDFDFGPYGGTGLCAKVTVSGVGVSRPLRSWNGVKFQFCYVEPETGLTRWRDASPRPTGDFDRVELVNDFSLAGTHPKTARLRLGLSEASGRLVFDLASLRVGVSEGMFRRVNEDYRVAYPPARSRRFRGMMSPSRDMTEDDFRTLKAWGVNLLRYQMVRNWSKFDDNRDLAEYDRWQDGRLDHLDAFVLPMAEKYGVFVIIDLHVFPGGRNAAKESNMLHDRRYADHFLERWRKIATRFKGRRNVYGYDLVNELNQNRRSDVTDYWNLQREAAEIVRAIDPDTTIVVGANRFEHPLEFAHLSPLRMSNVVYQVHMYQPGEFTHYRVHANERHGEPDPKMAYPSLRAGGERWDKDYLRKVLQPVRDFQLRHGAKIYAGEFSAAAWANGADRYLADCISLFEEYGWDWSYHAFRESPCWSVEREGTDADKLRPSADNPRKRVLIEGFARNNRDWDGSD